MTGQSAHRDVALWRYEEPPRAYQGFHLRARTETARLNLRDRLASLGSSDSHVLKLGAGDGLGFDRHRWKRHVYESVEIAIGEPQGDGDPGLSLAMTQTTDLVRLLDRAAPHEEGSVEVLTAEGARSLWVWWDAE